MKLWIIKLFPIIEFLVGVVFIYILNVPNPSYNGYYVFIMLIICFIHFYTVFEIRREITAGTSLMNQANFNQRVNELNTILIIFILCKQMQYPFGENILIDFLSTLLFELSSIYLANDIKKELKI